MSSKRITLIILLMSTLLILAGCCGPLPCKSGCEKAVGQSSCSQAESYDQAPVDKPCCGKMKAATPVQ